MTSICKSNCLFKLCYTPSFKPAYGILLLAFPHNIVTKYKSSFAVTHQARLVIDFTGVWEQVCVLKISELDAADWASRYRCHHNNPDYMATEKNCTPDKPKTRQGIKPKGGRPAKAEEEKKKLVSVYFTDKEREKITEDAGGLPLSLYIHHQTIYGKVVEPIPKELADALKDCSGMSNNLNQLTMKFNAAFKDSSDRRVQKLIQLTPQLEYQSQMIGQILIHIASLCSQR